MASKYAKINLLKGLCSNGCKLKLSSNSKWYCNNCLSKLKKSATTRRDRLASVKKCITCGKRRVSKKSKVRCSTCLKRNAQFSTLRRQRLARQNICTMCGKVETTDRLCNDCQNNSNKHKSISQKILRDRSPIHRLNASMSTSIRKSLKSGKGGRHWETLVPYTLKDLVVHLENKFHIMNNGESMTWNNYGIWHVDHIKPLSKCTSFEEAWAINNLQPLYGPDNILKSSHYQELV